MRRQSRNPADNDLTVRHRTALIYLQVHKNPHYVDLLIHQEGRHPFLLFCSGG